MTGEFWVVYIVRLSRCEVASLGTPCGPCTMQMEAGEAADEWQRRIPHLKSSPSIGYNV